MVARQKIPGRPHEASGDRRPREMVAAHGRGTVRGNRIRLIGGLLLTPLLPAGSTIGMRPARRASLGLTGATERAIRE